MLWLFLINLSIYYSPSFKLKLHELLSENTQKTPKCLYVFFFCFLSESNTHIFSTWRTFIALTSWQDTLFCNRIFPFSSLSSCFKTCVSEPLYFINMKTFLTDCFILSAVKIPPLSCERSDAFPCTGMGRLTSVFSVYLVLSSSSVYRVLFFSISPKCAAQSKVIYV